MRDTIELIRTSSENTFTGHNTQLKINGVLVSGIISFNYASREHELDSRYSVPNEPRITSWGFDSTAPIISLEGVHVNRNERLEQYFKPENIKSYNYRSTAENVNREYIELYANRIDMIWYKNKVDIKEYLRGSGILDESV